MNFTDRARMTKVNLATRTAVVTSGGAANGLSAAMPPFQDVLTAQQIRDVLAYVNQTFCH